MLRLLLITCAVLTGCSPVMNWREVRPDGTGVQALFPCKPGHLTRRLMMDGAPVDMSLHACDAGGMTWALGHADVGNPLRVATALAVLDAAAIRNVDASSWSARAFEVPGMTPNPQARRLTVIGKRSDGRAVQTHVVLFSKGTRVFQATVVGLQPSADAVQTFFDALRIAS